MRKRERETSDADGGMKRERREYGEQLAVQRGRERRGTEIEGERERERGLRQSERREREREREKRAASEIVSRPSQ